MKPPREGLLLLTASRQRSLLQNRNLPGMIKLMLRQTMQHVMEVVPLSRNAILKSFIGQRRNYLDEFIMRTLRLRNRLAPCGGVRCPDRRKIRIPSRLAFLTRETLARRAVPNRNVEHQFPNAVNT